MGRNPSESVHEPPADVSTVTPVLPPTPPNPTIHHTPGPESGSDSRIGRNPSESVHGPADDYTVTPAPPPTPPNPTIHALSDKSNNQRKRNLGAVAADGPVPQPQAAKKKKLPKPKAPLDSSTAPRRSTREKPLPALAAAPLIQHTGKLRAKYRGYLQVSEMEDGTIIDEHGRVLDPSTVPP